MNIQIHNRTTFADHSLVAHAERRARATLGRCLARVRRVIIEFTETGGIGHRASIRCFVRIERAGGPAIALDDTRTCAFAAVDRVLGTVARLIRRDADATRERAAEGNR